MKPLFFIAVFLMLSLILAPIAKASSNDSPQIWEIRSVDTMKTSRDKARAELNNPSYDTQIQDQLTAIKNTGANYVAIDTPYDTEFLPYLTRWVNLARQTGLRIWFRGNWSSWEGWFEYPKNMTPDEHIAKNTSFITEHPDLFQDGDIFDPCPECENAGFWPQPESDQAYREFIREQQASTREAFTKIGKNMYTTIPSIIGGRAKDVLDQKTLDALDNTVAIDHYFADPQSMTDYVNYFSKEFHTKVLVSEFGAPIPDINGDMNEQQQANFVDSVFDTLAKHKNSVIGINYYVLNEGTTSLINNNGSERQAYHIVKNYFTPASIKGRIINPLGDGIPYIAIKTSDGTNETKTNTEGYYTLAIPARQSFSFVTEGDAYSPASFSATFTNPGEIQTQDITLEPINTDPFYNIRLFFKNMWNNKNINR